MEHSRVNPYVNNLRDSNRLLLFRCVNILNKQQEIAEPLVGLFCLGKSECIRSHNYASLYWPAFHFALLREFGLDRERNER